MVLEPGLCVKRLARLIKQCEGDKLLTERHSEWKACLHGALRSRLEGSYSSKQMGQWASLQDLAARSSSSRTAAASHAPLRSTPLPLLSGSITSSGAGGSVESAHEPPSQTEKTQVGSASMTCVGVCLLTTSPMRAERRSRSSYESCVAHSASPCACQNRISRRSRMHGALQRLTK